MTKLIEHMTNTEESVLDFPKEDLSPAIWKKDENGNYVLTDNAIAKVQRIVDWAQQTFKIPDMKVNITGSITSNSYSSSSDIDIHFSSDKLKKDKVDDFNKLFRKKFEEFIQQNPDLADIDGVKTEIYMQPNPFQDMMSVGCYDFLNKRWIVGPDFKPTTFDPYAEYFMKDLKSVDDIIDGIRSVILQMYELSIVELKAKDIKFKEQVEKKLKATMSKATKVFNAIRARRSHKSSPKDAEEAMKNRDDKDWKIADSAFKLLDKFGYLKVLKQAKDSIANDEPLDQAAKKIIDAITEKISSKSLDDSEITFVGKLLEVEQQNESIGSAMRLSLIASLMSISSLLPATALAKTLKDAYRSSVQAKQQFNVKSPLVKQAIDDAAKGNIMIGEMSRVNVANALAQVLWREARGEGDVGIKAVASVIWNRAGGDPSYFIDVIKQKKQFSCLNSYSGGWIDATYVWFNPNINELKNKESADIWQKCKDVALDLIDKKFKSTIGNRNVYLNMATADKSNVDSWGKKCDLTVGKHKFGYLPEYDPKIVKPGTMTTWKKINKMKDTGKYVVVKDGQTLSKIAKDNNISLANILKLNPSLKDPNKISIGQKLRIA